MSEGNVTRSEILPLLQGPKLEGGWVMAFCPTHGDGQKHGMKGGRSLGLSKDGVLKCFAGCDFKDVIAALRERSGVVRQPRASTPRPATTRDGYELVEAYDYGLAVKGRFERPGEGKPDKTFRWRMPDSETWAGLQGVALTDMPLYFHEIVEAAPPEQRVWVVEGERARAPLHARQELAVCGAWGASQRDFGTAFEILRGRDVILWPDNDAPGREYMAAVARHLKGVARTIVTVAAPVPPKGDAVEYFAAHGTVEDLLASTLSAPTVDVLAHDHYRVRLPTDAGPVAFEFDQMIKSAGSLDCELTVTAQGPAAESEPYSLRINILSQTARAGLERALGLQFGKDLKWTMLVSSAFARARAAFLDAPRAVPIGQLPEMTEPVFSVSFADGTGIAPLGQPTIWFGDGGSLKTHTAEAMLIAVALGGTFQGFHAREQGAAMLIDYEADGPTFRFHCRRLLEGAGLDPLLIDDLPLHYWDPEGIPLTDSIQSLKQFVKQKGVRFVVVDSGADACGGEPEKAAIALAYFNALSQLGVTTVTICHVTNTDADATSTRPFGSRFWHNRARRTWYVKREQEEDSDELEVGIFCRKSNTGRRPRAVGLQVHFEGTTGPVRFRLASVRDLAAFENELPVTERIQSFLTAHGRGTVSAIHEATGIATASLRTALTRGVKAGIFVVLEAGGGRGREAVYGAAARSRNWETAS